MQLVIWDLRWEGWQLWMVSWLYTITQQEKLYNSKFKGTEKKTLTHSPISCLLASISFGREASFSSGAVITFPWIWSSWSISAWSMSISSPENPKLNAIAQYQKVYALSTNDGGFLLCRCMSLIWIIRGDEMFFGVGVGSIDLLSLSLSSHDETNWRSIFEAATNREPKIQ